MKKINYAVRFIVLVASLFAVQVSSAQFVEGQDYVKVAGIPESTKPMVREFFSYNCPHCYKQDGLYKETMAKLGKEIDFERTPVGVGRPSWQLSQEAYYLAQKFKVTEQVHGNLFKRIHEGVGAFTRKEELSQFFMEQGVAKADIEKAMASADNQLALLNYDTQAQLAGIKGVPTLLVNGKFMVTSKTHSPDELAALLKYLSSLE